jgi:ectoine hydroxylase-related dioxygenase (phytanoyl-CoA dioxygenase family)
VHTESNSTLTSVGFLAYLEPVGAESGALRVLPGSHHPQLGGGIRELGTAGLAALTLPDHVVATQSPVYVSELERGAVAFWSPRGQTT